MAEAEKYEVLEKIGHGSFGIIRKVRRKTDGHVLCRKEINYIRMSHKEREQLHAEFSILHSLRHPNIVAYYHREHLKASQDLHLYMEYCGNGDLGRVIKRLKEKNQLADEEFVWSIFTQLVTALYRCHYGVDPPEIGHNVMGTGVEVRPATVNGKSKVMILHRDLKPENVFLGEDNSVKLGDFGLSKIMQSHDFASTYVGTPFYMSPEICAAERYTLHSDIWSLGCIMYELCAREPPFTAKTHFQLIQKIKEGKVAPLPSVYSPELQSVIKSCLKVNPTQRPDTVILLNLPVVKLMRKEREVVDMGKILKTKEQQAEQRLKELEAQVQRQAAATEQLRQELEASIRREWEVKARLEIDRQVKIEMEHLHETFEMEVRQRVKQELQIHAQVPTSEHQMETATSTDGLGPAADIPTSSVSTNEDTYLDSVTGLTSLCLESPVPAKQKTLPRKSARTPFGRSRTMFDGSPMDVQMADPSPMSIASLSLSPRRKALAASNGQNLFGSTAQPERMQPLTLSSTDDEDDDDEDLMPPPPSPTRQKKPTTNGVKTASRPSMGRLKTAPIQKLQSQPDLFGGSRAVPKPPALPSLTSQPNLRPTTGVGMHENHPSKTPPRRISKIPSSTNLHGTEGASPIRGKPKPTASALHAPSPTSTSSQASGTMHPSVTDDMFKAAVRNNMLKGRTLVELAQARANGRERPSQTADGAIKGPREVKRSNSTKTLVGTRMSGVHSEPAAIWDPTRDEMPSPFLNKMGRANARVGTVQLSRRSNASDL
ncbi:MAG: G2-specific serine/threonine protein kinase [Caeruleum heppii]|nr:MAG: G2-specific serine/threonine protein kinase [Caeruleum heppii]